MPNASPTRPRDDEPRGATRRTTDKRLAVHVADGGTGCPVDLIPALGEALGNAARRLGAWGEVRVRLVLDAEMARDHEEFAGVPGTTDVLTFDLTDPEVDPIDGPTVVLERGEVRVVRPREVDADILVCVDEAKRQASARGHDLFRELLLYSVHGVLHCLGHDDLEEGQSAAMHAVEDGVLAELGLGAVYSRPPYGVGGAGGVTP